MNDAVENAHYEDANSTTVLRRRILKKAQESIDQGRRSLKRSLLRDSFSYFSVNAYKRENSLCWALFDT